MKRYGVNPYGESLYRCVWSDSRTHLVGGRWGDNQACEYRQAPLYPGVHAWILEKWLSPEAFAGSRDGWHLQNYDIESGLYTSGPYPERGEYTQCYAFPAGFMPGDSSISSVIGMLNASRNVSLWDKKSALLDNHAAKKKKRETRVEDVFRNAQGPFRGNAVSGIPGKRTAEKVQLRHTAQSLGKPVGDNKFFSQGA